LSEAPLTAPARSEPEVPDRVLVLGDDVRAFLAVVRSLGRRGLEVHVAPVDMASPALASSFIARVHQLPAYAEDPDGWQSALADLVAQFDYRLIVPTSDSSLVQLEHHAWKLGRQRLALPNEEAFALFTDKGRTRSLARRLGVPVAEGQKLASDADARALAGRYGVPLLLKPAHSYRVGDSRDKRSVELIRDLAGLRQALAAGGWRDSLVETYVPGFGVGVSVLAAKGRVVQAYQHRRLRQFSETGVSTSRISEAVDPRLLNDVERLVEASALDGVAMFEFRCDPAGRHVLLEVNPRFWGSLPLAIAAGADFPAMLYDQHQGRSPEVRDYRPGVIKTDLGGDYESRVIHSESEGPLLARLGSAILALLLPWLASPLRTDSWAADDPAPFRAERRDLVVRIRSALGKRLAGLPGARPRKPAPVAGALGKA
jgi:predicted ATP-grasp superfamily ATP-dependent carboligase